MYDRRTRAVARHGTREKLPSSDLFFPLLGWGVFILQISRARIFAVHSLDAMQVAPKTAVSSLLTMTFPSILAKKNNDTSFAS